MGHAAPIPSIRVESHVRLDPIKLMAALNPRALSAPEFAETAKVSTSTLSVGLSMVSLLHAVSYTEPPTGKASPAL